MPTSTYLNLKIEEFNLLNGILAASKLHGTEERKRGKNVSGYHYIQPLVGGNEGRQEQEDGGYLQMGTPRAQHIQSQS